MNGGRASPLVCFRRGHNLEPEEFDAVKLWSVKQYIAAWRKAALELMMKGEQPLLCGKDFKRTESARGNIKQEQKVNSSSERKHVMGHGVCNYACPRIEQAEGRRPIISGAAHGDLDHRTPHLCDMGIWILYWICCWPKQPWMAVIGSDEVFRRTVPHQEGGQWTSRRHGSHTDTLTL